MKTITYITNLEDERKRLNALAISIAHSARELALVSDIYSERIRQTPVFPDRMRQVETHLAQLRRSVADAQYMAETVRQQLDEEHLTWAGIHGCDATLNDA